MPVNNFSSESIYNDLYDKSSSKPGPEFNKLNPQDIIGLPPRAYGLFDPGDANTTSKILASMPVCRITPGIPKKVEKGIKLYDFDAIEGKTVWHEIIRTCGGFVDDSMSWINVAFIYEGPFNTTWQNSYAESMFENAGNKALPAVRELKYVTGKDTLYQALDDIGSKFDKPKANTPEEEQSIASDLFHKSLDLASAITGGAIHGAANLVEVLGKAFGTEGVGQVIGKLITGSNIDFPMIWNSSTYAPQYSITVKLVNPLPIDDIAYEFHIIQPLIKLLAFIIPRSDSASTYTYPLICRVDCPGLFNIAAGYIESIDLSAGGEENDISFFHRPNTVNLRITFGDLYSSMINFKEKKDESDNRDRPSLKKYIDNMRGFWTFPDPYGGVIPIVEDNSIITKSTLMEDDIQTVNGVSSYNNIFIPNRISPDKAETSTTLSKNNGDINTQNTDNSVTVDQNINPYRDWSTINTNPNAYDGYNP